MFELLLVLLIYSTRIDCYGYDSGSYDQNACGRQFRSGRLYKPPCDLTGGYCTSAGASYPWHAVKRFVQENQGLMKRMYGDQRHGQVLQAELDDFHYNRQLYAKQYDFNNLDSDMNEARYLRDEDINNDDVLNTKFVYSEEPAAISVKLGDLKTVPHFRPTTPTTSTSTSTIPTTIDTTDDITIESTTDTTPDSFKSLSTPTDDDVEVVTQPETVLFQDMDDTRTKPPVNYQMKGVNACPVKEEVVAPFWANNTRGEVLALLNMYPFEQYVHWEKCTHEHKQMYCRDGCRCEQQYRLHRLLAYDPNNECRGIFSDWFRFPSCCICKCYTLSPAEFRVTSRSPRSNVNDHNEGADDGQGLPDWYRRKNRAIFSLDHG